MVDEVEQAFRENPISQRTFIKCKIKAVLDIANKDPSKTAEMHRAASGITGYEATNMAAIDGKLYSLDIRDGKYVLANLSDNWQIAF